MPSPLSNGGNSEAHQEALSLVYEELRRIAHRYLRQERPGHTLQPTALVHEAYLRLVDQRRIDWNNRAQFVGLAATMMRRVLANYARNRAAAKRGGNADRVGITVAIEAAESSEVDMLALDDALERLHALAPRSGRVVELKYFGGLKTAEIADLLQVSVATVERDWTFARAWLYDAIGNGPGGHARI